MIIWGGTSISSEEIEALLLVCPGIADAAVVGAPDTVMGERVCAFVVQKPGQTVDLPSVNAYLTQKKGIAIYKQIERLELIDVMPRNPVGKIVKAQLREALKCVG